MNPIRCLNTPIKERVFKYHKEFEIRRTYFWYVLIRFRRVFKTNKIAFI